MEAQDMVKKAEQMFWAEVKEEMSIDEMAGMACEFCDEKCPFMEKCGECGMCYRCGVWEVSMGEDL